VANSQTNSKEQCKPITIRCWKQVGSDVITEAADNRKKTVENVVETGIDRSEDRVESETVAVEENIDAEFIKVNEKSIEGSSKKQAEKGLTLSCRKMPRVKHTTVKGRPPKRYRRAEQFYDEAIPSDTPEQESSTNVHTRRSACRFLNDNKIQRYEQIKH